MYEVYTLKHNSNLINCPLCQPIAEMQGLVLSLFFSYLRISSRPNYKFLICSYPFFYLLSDLLS